MLYECRTVHLNVRALFLSKGQAAQEVEKSSNLLGSEVVHVVQDSLCQTSRLITTKHN